MKYCCFFFFLLIGLSVGAQHEILEGKFVNYDLKNGINNGSVYSITQDNIGFIYAGTSDGVFRFDGLQFEKIVNPFHSSQSLGHVTGMHFDEINNEVLIASYKGLYGYSTEKDTIRLIDPQVIHDFEKDTERKCFYYVGYNKDFNFLRIWHPTSHKVQTVRLHAHESARDVIRSKEDPDIWFLSHEGINIYNSKYDIDFRLVEPSEINKSKTNFDDLRLIGNKLYAASIGRGVLEIDVSTKKIKEFTYREKTSARFNMVRHISVLNDSLFSIATSDKGIGTLNLKTGKFSFYKHDPSDLSSISLLSGRSTFFDKQGNMWAAMAESLSVKSLSNDAFKIETQDVPLGFVKRELKARNAIYVLDSLILQGSNKSIFVYDKDGNAIENPFEMPTKDFGITKFETYSDKLIYGYSANTLYKIDLDLFKITKVLDAGNLTNEWDFNTNKIFGVIIRNDSFLLHNFNEFRWGRLTDFEPISKKMEFHEDRLIYSVKFKETIYFIGLNGLYELKDHGSITRIEGDLDSFFAENEDFYMTVSEKGLLITSLLKGAVLYQPDTKKILKINIENGARTNQLARGVVDQQGNIWLTSSAGLHVYNEIHKTVSIFDKRDNVWSNDLLPDFINRLGPSIGISVDLSLNTWKPSEMHLEEQGPDIQLISVNGENEFRQQYPASTEKISIRYSTFRYGKNDRDRYFYSINNRPWQLHNEKGMLELIALEAGDYLLQFKIIDGLGRVGYSPKYNFSIDRYWYTSWWFYGILGGILALGSYLIISRFQAAKEKTEIVKQRYEGIAKDLENQVMRSQMNPHFLFNSLNSIRYYIKSNETEIAADYLTKFSRLIRNILENSTKDKISLQEEMNTIAWYVELEKLRFNDKFDFKINIAPDILPQSIFIPPMLIQPFLENAIIHGINPKPEPSTLVLTIEHAGQLLITIMDDGIGREAAHKLKERNSLKKASLGQNITERRLELLSNNMSSNITISDLHPEQKYKGTKVVIRIPI